MKHAYAAALLSAMMAVYAGAETPHTLLGRNMINVTESRVTCKNGNDASVTTGVTGELHLLSTTRTDFKGDTWMLRMAELDRVPDDERGHVVASMFGGPAESWNLVPMHRSVNRKINAQSSLLNRWDEFEDWARKQLGKRNGAPVRFTIRIKYAAQNGCRPTGFNIVASSKSGTGFTAYFDNSPHRSFAMSSKPKRQNT